MTLLNELEHFVQRDIHVPRFGQQRINATG
jgi:hypothetical protein